MAIMILLACFRCAGVLPSTEAKHSVKNAASFPVQVISFGDDLTFQAGARGDELTCNDPDVPVDGSNLVLKVGALALWMPCIMSRMKKDHMHGGSRHCQSNR